MSSRNATASWSGYAHQGKIGLLVAIRKIRFLNCTGLAMFQIEQETREDVCIKTGSTILEVHQVKAYMSTDAISSYRDALQDFEPGTTDNYLHSILEIQDWNTLIVAQNPHNVVRYSYSPTQNFCPLDQIDNIILNEISLLLALTGHLQRDNRGFHQSGYHEYLALLDKRIRFEHQNGNKATYCVSIGLDEILEILRNPPARLDSITCAIRKGIFEQYVDLIKILDDNGYPEMSDEHEIGVTNIIQMFCKLDDDKLEDFLFQIFPASTQGKRLSRCVLTDDFFVGKDFASTFLKTLICTSGVEPVIEGGTYPHYKIEMNYLITALQQQPEYISKAAKQILQNDRLNTARYEADFIINENFEGKLSNHAYKNINRNGGIISEQDLEFITRVAATDKLNNL